MSRLVACALAIQTMAASTARAQTVREFERAMDSTSALASQARAAYAAYSTKRPEPRPSWSDSTVIGSGRVMVRFNKQMGPIATEAIARTRTALAGLGRATETFPRLIFSIGGTTRDKIVIGYYPATGGLINTASPPDVPAVAKTLTDRIVGLATDASRTPFSKWRREIIPVDSADVATPPAWGLNRLRLISSISLLGRTCYGGDVDACAKYLGLRSDPDPVMAWYDSLARVNRVRDKKDWVIRNQAGATQRCLAGQDKECGVALTVSNEFVDPPGDDDARGMIIWQAISMGGRGATERLLTASGSPSDALAAAANAPIDSVIDAWRRHTRDEQAGSPNLSPTVVLVAIAWIAVLTIVALGNSRWR